MSDSGWQDPSTDIANVNAAYRIEHKTAEHYRKALELIVMNADGHVQASYRGALKVSGRIAREALLYDPLKEDS